MKNSAVTFLLREKKKGKKKSGNALKTPFPESQEKPHTNAR